jgi:outer membrane protein OmpA-like peptidoglycan-associated protein
VKLRTIVLASLLALAGCAAPPVSELPPDRVVLLPGSDGGSSGAVVVQRGKAEATLDREYTAARAAAGGTLEVAPVDAAEVRAQFKAVLDAMPPAPTSFTVYFVFGQDELTEDSRKEFAPVLQEFARRPAPEIVVTGHADQVGPERVNDTLSQRRADRVKDMLIQRGVRAERITAVGRGAREPAVRGPDGLQEPRNRRVEISVR